MKKKKRICRDTLILPKEKKIEALNQQFLVAPIFKKQEGGLILIEKDQDKQTQWGEIISTKGVDQKKIWPIGIEVGDLILYGEFSATRIKNGINSKTHVLIELHEVLAIIKKNKG